MLLWCTTGAFAGSATRRSCSDPGSRGSRNDKPGACAPGFFVWPSGSFAFPKMDLPIFMR
jgi:hypothetical protein